VLGGGGERLLNRAAKISLYGMKEKGEGYPFPLEGEPGAAPHVCLASGLGGGEERSFPPSSTTLIPLIFKGSAKERLFHTRSGVCFSLFFYEKTEITEAYSPFLRPRFIFLLVAVAGGGKGGARLLNLWAAEKRMHTTLLDTLARIARKKKENDGIGIYLGGGETLLLIGRWGGKPERAGMSPTPLGEGASV